MHHIASVSFGKDSLAMLLLLIEKGYPLDEVVFYDTGMEFNAIYEISIKVQKILSENQIKYTILTPNMTFEYKMFEKPVKNRDGSGYHYGYSWCGGRCRWGTTDKLKALDKYAESLDAVVYLGIASDEMKRTENKQGYKKFPLVDWDMPESDCLKYCHEKGWSWLEKSPTGCIDLYGILDRVSCWCCANKNRKELKNIYTYLPGYWSKLKDFQSRTDRPMKNFYNKKYGDYGNVFDMEKVFEKEK